MNAARWRAYLDSSHEVSDPVAWNALRAAVDERARWSEFLHACAAHVADRVRWSSFRSRCAANLARASAS